VRALRRNSWQQGALGIEAHLDARIVLSVSSPLVDEVLSRRFWRSCRTERNTGPVTDLVKQSAVWMAGAVDAREVSAVELLEAHASRIDARNPEVNAIVVSREEVRLPTRRSRAARFWGRCTACRSPPRR
jgi:hypothetical protein